MKLNKKLNRKLTIILICVLVLAAAVTIISIKKGSGTQGTVKYKRFEKLTQPSGQVIQIGDYSFELEKYFLDIASAQFYAVYLVCRCKSGGRGRFSVFIYLQAIAIRTGSESDICNSGLSGRR